MNFYYLDDLNNENQWWGMFIRDCKQFINLKPLSKHNNKLGIVLIENQHWQQQKDEVYSIIKKYAQNNNLIFCLSDTSEGYPTTYLYYPFFEYLDECGIEKKRRLFMYNNAFNVTDGVKECELFYTWYYPSFVYEFSSNDIVKKENFLDTADTYDFSCFNRRSKQHKLETVKKIVERNLNSATTHDLRGDTDYTHKSFLKGDDLGCDVNRQYLLDDYYFWGKVNICTESEYYSTFHEKSTADCDWQWDDMIHLTEKVFRNIAWGIPYVLISSKGSLNEIRRLGFKTFNSIIDESYDTADDSVRINLSLNAAEELLKKYNSDELNEILEYNKKKIRTYYNDVEFFNTIVYNPLKNHINNLVI